MVIDMSNFIDFTNVDLEVDPAVKTLVREVGERIGERKLSAKERKKKLRERKKAEDRKRRGLAQIFLDLHPGVKETVEGIARELNVPVSQVVNEILVEMLESCQVKKLIEEMGEKLEFSRSRRFAYSLPYRDSPIKIKGQPLENEGIALRK
jgi:hypothetical protein